MGSSSNSALKEAAAAQREATKVQKRGLNFAKQQFELFAPVIRQFSNFFQDVPLDDIVSGRVLSERTATDIGNVNRAFDAGGQALSADLARRGISDSGAAVGQLSDFFANRSRAVSETRAAGIDRDVAQRQRFGEFGLSQTLPAVSSATAGLARSFSDQARTQLSIAEFRENEDVRKQQALTDLAKLGTFAATGGFGG